MSFSSILLLLGVVFMLVLAAALTGMASLSDPYEDDDDALKRYLDNVSRRDE